MFDLNMTATPLEGEFNPQDSGTEKKPLQTQAHSGMSAAPKPGASSSRNYSFDPSDLAHLLMMVKDLPNDLPSPPNLMQLNSNHARLPPHTSAFSETPATAWRGSTSAVPTHLAVAAPAPGDGAPADREVLVWPRNGAGGGLPAGNQNEASPCQTSMDLDSHSASDGESDSWKQAPLVDLDSLPDEIPVDSQYPWSPVHQDEAPFHTTLFRGFSDDLPASAMLPPMSPEDELRLRELAFHACFKLETGRCTHEARCRGCLAFCGKLFPEGCGPGGDLELLDECPPVLKNDDDEEARELRKKSRHGPKSKSSEFRGVTFYKRTGRWEAHIWHEGSQTYLGASKTKEEAARAHDQAALVLCGPAVDINFKPESYKMEVAYLYKLTKLQLEMYLRRDSRGFGAQVSYPGVKRVKDLYQAFHGSVLLGTFATEEDAARALYKEAVRNPFGGDANLILDVHHVRNMPSYAAQRFAALYPEAVKEMQLRNQATPIPCKRPRVPRRAPSPQKQKRLTRQSGKPNQDFASPPAAARVIAAPLRRGATDKLPGYKINKNIEASPGALTPDRSRGANQAPNNATGMNPMATQQHPQQPSNGTNTPTLQQLRDMLPKFIRAPAAATASSTCQAPSDSSIPRETGEASSSGVIKFKLFNVEISVAEEPGHGGDRTEAHGESEPQLYDQFISRQRKRCRIMGAAARANRQPAI